MGKVIWICLIIVATGVIIGNSFVRVIHIQDETESILEKASIFIMSLILLVWIIRYFMAIIIWRMYSIGPEYPVEIGHFPKVSIIIPAKNEEAKIRRCLESIQKAEYTNMEIIVIDDRSSDRTGEIVAEISKTDARIKLIQGEEKPAGWSGKIYALYQAVSHANGDWLLFIDADVAISQKNIIAAINYCLKNDLDMISIALKPHLEGFWENVVMPVVFGLITCAKPLNKINDPDSSTAFASGGYILVKASSYRDIGGHEAIKGSLVDDVQLAKLAKSKGILYRFLLGPNMGIQRWYKNFREIWAGWSKNIFAGMDYKVSIAIMDILLVFSMSILPYIVLIQELITSFLNGNFYSPILWLAIAQVAFISLSRLHTSIKFGNKKWYFLTQPLGSAIFIGIIINSAFRDITGRGVVWKDRHYMAKKE